MLLDYYTNKPIDTIGSKFVVKFDIKTDQIISEACTLDIYKTVRAILPNKKEMYFIGLDEALESGFVYIPNYDVVFHPEIKDIPVKPKEGYNTFKFSSSNLIENNFNTYRITEGLNYTFGVEMETATGYIPDFIAWKYNMDCVRDGSITGGEYITGVLKGDLGFVELSKITKLLIKNCTVDHKCGLHVHIGGINNNKLFTVAAYKLGLLLQDEIFSMLPNSRLKTRNTYYSNNNRTSACDKLKPINILKIPYNKTNLLFDIYIDECYNEIFNWLSDNKTSKPNNKINKKYSHPSGKYPNSRYVWLNLVPLNFTKNNNEILPTNENINLKNLNKKQTIEFRNHSASLNYKKIKNWILICMAFVNYVENRSLDILNSEKLTLFDVLSFSYKNNLNHLMEYIEKRKAKFVTKTVEENWHVEDQDYIEEINYFEEFDSDNKINIIKYK
ncbi:MAG: amidoligase family protein [Candidatus Woesearchaeota archaeon]